MALDSASSQLYVSDTFFWHGPNQRVIYWAWHKISPAPGWFGAGSQTRFLSLCCKKPIVNCLFTYLIAFQLVLIALGIVTFLSHVVFSIVGW
jgi:hypothetical protein